MFTKKTFLVLLFVGMLLFPSALALAHTPPLFPVGFWGPIVSCGYEGGPACKDICDLVHTAQHLVYLSLTILVFIIVPIAVIAGGIFIMVSSGDEGKLKKGRQIVTSAVIGLAIGLGAFLIINSVLWALGGLGKSDSISWPNIQCSVGAYAPPVESGARGINANLPPPKTSGEHAGLPPGTFTDDEARTRIALAGIAVNKKNCTFEGQTNCTSFDGIPASVVTGLEDMKKECGCNMTVTAGTEAGHKTHGPGKPVVDLTYGIRELNEYVYSQIGTTNPEPNRFAYNGKDGNTYLFEDDPPHWHVRF